MLREKLSYSSGLGITHRSYSLPRDSGRVLRRGLRTATSRRSRTLRRLWSSVAWLWASNPRSFAPTPATTGGRRHREKQDYSNGLDITPRSACLEVTSATRIGTSL